MSETLFISDLHLSDERPDITDQFLDFLSSSTAHADGLYILGDLFEAWIGDDAMSAVAQAVSVKLKSLRDEGLETAFLHGNRDFLLGKDFATRAGLDLLVGPTVLDLYGRSVLVAHGDEYCVDDHEYMAFRSLVRDPDWQATFLRKPIAERIAIAKQARAASKTQTATKAADIMDVNPAAVEQALVGAGVRILLHGHTHRPNVHDFEVAGEPAQRIVLGDWYEQGSLVRFSSNGFELETLPR